ncbi:MAG: hypothetical protein ACK55I_28405, partial [bacterium]
MGLRPPGPRSPGGELRRGSRLPVAATPGRPPRSVSGESGTVGSVSARSVAERTGRLSDRRRGAAPGSVLGTPTS